MNKAITTTEVLERERAGQIQFVSIMDCNKTSAETVFLFPTFVDLYELHWLERQTTYKLRATATTDTWELVKLREGCLKVPIVQGVNWRGNGYNADKQYGPTDTRRRRGVPTQAQWHRDIQKWRLPLLCED